jgi:magnesium transporter
MTTEARKLARKLGQEFERLYPDQAAAELERVAIEEVARFLEEIPAQEAATLLNHLSPDTAGRALTAMGRSVAAKIVEALEPPAAARLLARLEDEARTEVLACVKASDAAELKQLISYPSNTAAALMDPQVLALNPRTTVRDALKRLRALREKKIHRIFLIDIEQRLLGSVSIRDLALAEPSTPLEQLDVTPPTAVQAMASHEEVVEILARARAASLPVVDLDGRILGVLRHDALVEATREDATVDMQSMVGAGKEERALSKASLAVRKRLPWLQVNLATAFLAASVVGLFEETIARYTALAVLLPVVAGQSGNTGAQALAVTMRGLALREIRTRQWLRVCLKEMNVGAINGVAVALTTSLGVLVWSRSLGLALVIGSSMILSMVAAGLSGAGVPLVLTALGQDPAQSSSIILTTITDVVGFFSFLGIATLLAGLL